MMFFLVQTLEFVKESVSENVEICGGKRWVYVENANKILNRNLYHERQGMSMK